MPSMTEKVKRIPRLKYEANCYSYRDMTSRVYTFGAAVITLASATENHPKLLIGSVGSAALAIATSVVSSKMAEKRLSEIERRTGSRVVSSMINERHFFPRKNIYSTKNKDLVGKGTVSL